MFNHQRKPQELSTHLCGYCNCSRRWIIRFRKNVHKILNKFKLNSNLLRNETELIFPIKFQPQKCSKRQRESEIGRVKLYEHLLENIKNIYLKMIFICSLSVVVDDDHDVLFLCIEKWEKHLQQVILIEFFN